MADSAEVATALAAFCREFDGVRAILQRTRDAGAVDRLMTAAKANRPITRELNDVDTALVRAGVPGGLRGVTSRLTDHSCLLGAGADDGRVTFVCPEDRCNRRWSPSGPADGLPECAVLGRKLVWKSS